MNKFVTYFSIAILVASLGATTNADVVFDSDPGADYLGFLGRTDGSLTGDVTVTGEDYIMSAAALSQGPLVELIDFSFVGGISQDPASTDATFSGGQLIFDWYDTGGALSNSIAFNLLSGGNFIYNDVAVGSGFFIPTQGFFDIRIDGTDPANLSTDALNHTAQWFLTGTAPSVGTSPGDSTFGNGDHAFVFDVVIAVPEPATASILGVALLGTCLIRRRKNS